MRRQTRSLAGIRAVALGLTLVLVVAAPLAAQEVYRGCGLEGSAKSEAAKRLNRLKNRYAAPRPEDFDPRVTLAALLAGGDDEGRWEPARAARVEGYVLNVKPGGVETCNCGARDPLYRDTHIELVVDPVEDAGEQRVIVEVTPRWRALMLAKGLDWSTKALRRRLLGRWVRVEGWLLFDTEHADEAENTRPGRPRNWRGTAWEVHPITRVEVIDRPR